MSETTAVNQNSKTPREDVCMVPPVDVIEDKAGITLHADLPGVPKDKLNLHVDADTLTIEGEVALGTPEGMESTHAEVNLPRYRRTFTLDGCRYSAASRERSQAFPLRLILDGSTAKTSWRKSSHRARLTSRWRSLPSGTPARRTISVSLSR